MLLRHAGSPLAEIGVADATVGGQFGAAAGECDPAGLEHVAAVGELEGGLALMWRGVRLTYVQTWQSAGFRHQSTRLFNFGSLALSVRF